ncbi:MAG: ATP-binding protein [Aulosira sp. ZfuVER01]|nr:PAS domain S-box protein [Aulosira sp. ZfuVER01]MDZ8002776.1 PAS domain S-box protein [Aulosira sp. DedVER01a]MDZ8054406.1 PAS domain S-box protein [Aulosira sp. ZfuCHP01]
MTPEDRQLDQQIVAAQERLEQLQQPTNSPSNISNDLFSVAITELSVALEELRVTAEELHQQNEELQNTRQMLDLERQRYRDLFQFAPDAYLVTDKRGIILEANYAAHTLLNVWQDYLVGKPLSVFVFSGDRAIIYEQLEKLKTLLAEDGQNLQMRNNLPSIGQQQNIYSTAKYLLQDREVSLTPRQKELLPTAVSLSAECSSPGLVRLYWSFRDLSDRKQVEEKIREQAALLDIATDAIFVCDLEYRILYWNSAAESLYGWQVAEIVGKDSRQLLYQQISSQAEDACKTVLEQGEWHGELNKITKSGQAIIVSSRWTLVCNDAGQAKSILCVESDLTEKKLLERQFYQLQRLESLGTLASGIAHDFNNILTPILTVAQLLPLKLPDINNQNRELLRIIAENSQRAKELVKQILSFAGGGEGKRIPLKLKHSIEEIERVVKTTFPKSLEICINLPTSNLGTISADPTQIHQVLMNLCVNARDAMSDGGTLTITAENRMIDEIYAQTDIEAKPGFYNVVTISDTGTGIPPEFLERIFEPFFTTKEVGKGTGLGLSTVLGIVKNLGGFVKVQSELGKGSKFQVYLPIVPQAITESIIEKELPQGNGELILIVDDEKSLQQTTKLTLENNNYKTLIANNGVEAIDIYTHYKTEISVVFMDMMMPNMDGLITTQILCNINPDVKIIATSGLSTHRQNFLDAGAKAFLSKPYTAMNLLQSLSQVITTNK